MQCDCYIEKLVFAEPTGSINGPMEEATTALHGPTESFGRSPVYYNLRLRVIVEYSLCFASNETCRANFFSASMKASSVVIRCSVDANPLLVSGGTEPQIVVCHCQLTEFFDLE